MDAVKILKALADEGRFKIFNILVKNQGKFVPVKELKRLTRMEPTLLSHHLHVMKLAGLARSQRNGKCVDYMLVGGLMENGILHIGTGLRIKWAVGK
jgi:DNA-binding transcriptional ArsR family regulator